MPAAFARIVRAGQCGIFKLLIKKEKKTQDSVAIFGHNRPAFVCIAAGCRVEFRAFRRGVEVYLSPCPSFYARGMSVQISKPSAKRSLLELEIMKTFSAKPEEVRRDWYLVDATGKTLGRLSTEIARRLRGKHKPEYTPHVDTGDYIVVVNADKIRVTGNKMKDKMYHRYTGYIGNLKSIPMEKMMSEAPERALQYAVKGMLPRNPLGRKMYSKLRVFAGPEHNHEAQQPIPLDINA